MIRLMRLIGLALMTLSVWMAAPVQQVAYADPSLDAAEGKKVWDAKACKSCHGANAEGKYARVLAGYDKTADDIIKQVRTPRNAMPAFSATVISDVEIRNLFDYLKTLTPPASFTAQTYQAQAGDDPGKVLFNQKRCAACHGENAERVAQIVLGRGGKTITADEIKTQVRTPRRNMPVFRPEYVTDADIAAMAPFLKSVVEKAAAAAPAAATTPAPAAAATPAPAQAPATLPKTGAETPLLPYALIVGLVGITLLGASFVLRRRSAR
jgi:mono/diheme cytochrome c family protein